MCIFPHVETVDSVITASVGTVYIHRDTPRGKGTRGTSGDAMQRTTMSNLCASPTLDYLQY